MSVALTQLPASGKSGENYERGNLCPRVNIPFERGQTMGWELRGGTGSGD